VIQGIAGVGIGLLVGLLARPFFDAYIAARTWREARREYITDDTTERVTSP
jgi:hypothetical protein